VQYADYRMRPRIRVILICLLAGTLLSFAMAWGTAIVTTRSGQRYPTYPELRAVRHPPHADQCTFHHSLWTWDLDSRDDGTTTSVDAYGFPFRCMKSVRVIETFELPLMSFRDGSWVVTERVGPEFRLPLSPMWIGMLADSAIFGIVVWLLLAGWSSGRRWLRRRSGRCPRCGYDRAGLAVGAVCPECGAPALTSSRVGDHAPAEE